ncbi:MAG: nitrilase-related carbon-nitrogen hydrolase [Myxococcota bacterium]
MFVKVATVQMNIKFADVKYNVEHAIELLQDCDARIIVLPELFNTGYMFDSPDDILPFSEPKDGYTIKTIHKIAKEKNCYITGGFAERDGEDIYNSSFIIGPEGLIGIYRKAHLFRDEKKVFKPGNLPLKLYNIDGFNVGLMICFDWLFPEIARSYALMGADIICHSANLVLPFCPDALITRALENRIYFILSNRIGKETMGERFLRFIGESEIVSPDGDVLVRAGKDCEGVFDIEINPFLSRDKNITPLNDIFEDRRTDLYSKRLLSK